MTDMNIDNLKNELSETAQEELKGFVSETVEQKVDKAVEKKLHKEMKKLARKITVNLILTGAVVAGAVLVITNADKLVKLSSDKLQIK